MCADICVRVSAYGYICIQVTDAQKENAAESGSNAGLRLAAECKVININIIRRMPDGACRNSGCALRHTPFLCAMGVNGDGGGDGGT